MTFGEQKPNLGRHKRNCSLCCHSKLAEIESDFISWRSPAAAQEYGLADRTSVYRHAHAFGLFPKRQRNVRAALENNWVDRSEHVDLNALFEKMTAHELEAYAQDGSLPAWFRGSVGSHKTGNGSQRNNYWTRIGNFRFVSLARNF